MRENKNNLCIAGGILLMLGGRIGGGPLCRTIQTEAMYYRAPLECSIGCVCSGAARVWGAVLSRAARETVE